LARRIVRGLAAFSFAALLLAIAPSTADAQWYFANYLGGNHTSPATVSINQASSATSLQFHDVHFESRSLRSPQYYGARIGYLFPNRRIAVEFEFIHEKVISLTTRTVHVTGTLAGAPIDTQAPMDFYVDRYSMTHGLNFLVINLVSRTPIGGANGRSALMLRGGVGPTRPGVDTSVLGVSIQRYEYAGIGGDAAAGVSVRLLDHFTAIAEYKFTYARPTISVDGGKGQMTARTQQIAIGFALGRAR
jgi:hypothetical protein